MTNKEPSQVVAYWLDQIKASRTREKRYRTMGKEVLALYEADEEEETPFNILYSNTETLRPALYSAQPRSVVQRRFKDDDPLGKLASDANRRMLDYHLDTNKEDYETLNEAMGSAVLDALLPGRGMIQAKLDVDFVSIEEPRPPDEQDDEPIAGKPRAEYAAKEQVCFESVLWDRVHFGYAKKWTKVPWLAYEYHLTKEEVAGLLGKKIATKLTYHKKETTEEDDKKNGKDDEKDGARKTACLYQIWDKAGGKKVRYVSPNYVEGELHVIDDPLGLTGFFNTPRPLMFVEKSCSLVPTAPYKMYKPQADELNRITRRIKNITEAIKARGLYMGDKGADIEKVMQKDDNALVPMEATSLAGMDKGMKDLIWFVPIEILIAVVQQLYQAREACKQTIYEITGIADIMRGATNASETLGAQQIKNQWGTLRLKRMQSEVQRYVRDLLRMTAEIAGEKFDEETWAKMTGLPFLLSADKMKLDAQAALYTQSGQPMPPELQQKLGTPVWGEVLAILKDDRERAFRIDIETNSTIQPEAAEDQEGITTLLTAFGQTMQSIGPLVLQGVLPFQAAQNLLLFIARRFRFGSEIEDEIKAMQPPKPPDDGKAKEQEMQQKMAELEKQYAIKEIDYKQKEAEMSVKQQAMQAEMEHKQREMDLQYREAAQGIKEQQFGMQQKVEKGMLDLHKERTTEEIGTKQKVADLENKKYKTENVVNAKADTALGQGVKTMQGLVQQLAEMVAQQAQQNQQMIQELTTAITKPRTKRAIRGKDGKIEAVEEMVA
jgi:hypothetical protein